MPHRRTTNTEPGQNTALSYTVTKPTELHQYCIVLRQTQRTTTTHPWQRSGGCSRIIEEREVSWNWQHSNRTGVIRRRGCNHCSHVNVQQDLADRKMANSAHPVLSHHTFQGRQPAAVPELPNDQPHQPPKQSHAKDHNERIEAASEEDHCWRTGTIQSRKEHHRADLPPENPLRNISSTSKTSAMSS